MKKYNKKVYSYTIRLKDTTKLSVKVICFLSILLASITPSELKYNHQGRIFFLWGLMIFGVILTIVNRLILGNRGDNILLDINSTGVTLLTKGKEKHFEWDDIESIHLRYDMDSEKIQPMFFVKPIRKPEVGVPLGYYMEIPSLHARKIKRVVFECTGRKEILIDEYPPYWELLLMPRRIVKRYYKRKQENGQ